MKKASNKASCVPGTLKNKKNDVATFATPTEAFYRIFFLKNETTSNALRENEAEDYQDVLIMQ